MKKTLIFLSILLSLVACGPTDKQIQEAIEKTNVAIAEITAKAPTRTPLPTNTLQPTFTPTISPTTTTAPTNTPESTPTPENTPTNTPTATPEFLPVVVAGNGDQFIDVPEEFKYGFVDFEYKGDSNFIVRALDANNELIDGLVNTIGNYSGRRSLGFWGDYPKRLQIKTRGEWTATISPLELAYVHQCELPGICSGKGDDVIFFKPWPDTGLIEHKGEQNFIVRALAEPPTTIINEIGPYKGAIVFPYGTRFVEIRADGEWTMELTTK